MKSRRVTALALGALWLCSCDIVADKIREAGGNTRPGGSSSGGGSATPPPAADAGTTTACRSTSECGPGLTCSTEWGVCNPPPGCRPGAACPAVCSGFCETSKPDPVPPPPTPPNRCLDWTGAGDETTCKSQEEWKLHAYEACKVQNLVLHDYGVGGGDCAPGKTNQVKYQCCAPAPSVPSDPGTGSPTPGTGSGGTSGTGACTGGADGGETSCKTAETWKQYAGEYCARQNLSLTEVSYADSCGAGLYRFMKYTCCGSK